MGAESGPGVRWNSIWITLVLESNHTSQPAPPPASESSEVLTQCSRWAQCVRVEVFFVQPERQFTLEALDHLGRRSPQAFAVAEATKTRASRKRGGINPQDGPPGR